MEVSKELFEEVTGYLDMTEDIRFNPINNSIGYTEYNYNIHEFGSKCKNWLHFKNYIIETCFEHKCSNYHTLTIYWMSKQNKPVIFEGNSEIEVIVEACQWLLNKNIGEE